MNDSSTYEALVARALFGELNVEEARRFEALLDADPSRAAAFREMKATVELMAGRPHQEPDPAYWATYYDRLMTRIDTQEQVAPRRRWYERLTALRRPERWLPSGFAPVLLYRSWVFQLSLAVALVAVGVAIGLSLAEPPSVPAHDTPQVADGVLPDGATGGTPEYAALHQRAGHYLDRSKVLLLGLVNFEGGEDASEAINWPLKQAIARELVQEAHLMKDELNDREEQRLYRLMQDLEVILLQIANLESEHDLASIELVQSGVDERAVLLKINLAKMRMTAAAEAPGAGTTRPIEGI